MLSPADRVYRNENTGEIRVVSLAHSPEFIGPPEGFVELIPVTSAAKSLERHLSTALLRLNDSTATPVDDGHWHAQLLATQAVAEALVALVHAVRGADA